MGRTLLDVRQYTEEDAERPNDAAGTSEGIPDRRRTHIEEDAGEQRRSRSSERGKRSVTQNGAKGRRAEADDGSSIEESVEEGVGPGHTFSGDRGGDGDKHPTLDAELTGEVGVEAEGEECSDGEPTQREALTFNASFSGEEETETEPGADSEEDNEQDCKNISEDSLGGAEAVQDMLPGVIEQRFRRRIILPKCS